MNQLSIRTTVWILAAWAAAVAAVVAVLPAARLVPMARQMRAASAPLAPLYGRLAVEGRWIASAVDLAERAVEGDDSLAHDSLERLIWRHDLLTGTLPLAEVPDSVRLLLARADEVASRFVAAVEEVFALQKLGRQAQMRAGLRELHRLEGVLGELMGKAQVRGLDRVLGAQHDVEGLGAMLVTASLLWLGVVALIIAAALWFLHRRVERPLVELRRALQQVRGGDLSVVLAPVADDEIGGLVTEFNQMTRMLRARAETQGQMAAASELLGSAAHEINNPLMAVSSTVEELLASGQFSGCARSDLEAVLEETGRAGRLLRAIVRFVRPRPPAQEPIDLNEVVRDAWDLVAGQFASDGIAGSLTLAPDLPRVHADAQRVEHVVVSLLANAHQVLRRSGKRGGEVQARTWAEDGGVRAEVRDNGAGVPPDLEPRLFQPFVSERADGHVGLGLYTARLIMREHGGDLVHQAPTGGGARFVLSLPAVAPAVGDAAPTQPVATAAPGVTAAPGEKARETLAGLQVLVVDDEPMVRLSLMRFLMRRGAVVRQAADGVEALALLTAEAGDAVITDLRMPGLDGIGLFRALRERDPTLAARVLFLSGDVAQLSDLNPEEIPHERVLSKPVPLGELERVLQSFLRVSATTTPSSPVSSGFARST